MLLGEGIEGILRVFTEFLRKLGRDDVHVDHFGGKVKIRNGIQAFVRRPGFSQITSLAITRDADFLNADAVGKTTASAAAFESVRNALSNASLPAPENTGEFCSGTFAAREIRVGAFIFPGGGRDGMLEDLCLDAVGTDGAIGCVDEMFKCVKQQANRECAPNAVAKARIHAWLSTQLRPDLRLGEAASEGYFNWDDPAFDDLKSFLKLL